METCSTWKRCMIAIPTPIAPRCTPGAYLPRSINNMRESCGAYLLMCRDLSHNNLTGTIPPSIGGLRFLAKLDMSNNQLQGDLSIIPRLQALPIENGSSLANNQFDCPLPTWASLATPCYCMYLRHPPTATHQSIDREVD